MRDLSGLQRQPGNAPKPATRIHRFRAQRLVLLALMIAGGCRSGPPAATPAVQAAPPSAAAEEVVTRTNTERARLRLPALGQSVALMRAAQIQADQMAATARMAHEIPGTAYPTLDARLDAVGYRRSYAGENVAEGQPSAAVVVAGWMTSAGHRENIVSTHYTEMGAGTATGRTGRRYWVQVFAAPR